MAPKVLVLTSADKIVKLDKPTGWYLPELAHPHEVLAPKGGAAPLDPTSVEMFKADPASANFLDKHKHLWEQTKPLKDFVDRASEFDAIFYPGDHGPMYDLVHDKDSIKLIEEFNAAGKSVASVCHGPIALVHAKANGQPLLKGRRVTSFTNEEEIVKLRDAMPFLLEDKVKRVGAHFVAAPQPWGEQVVVDGNITGQNPASAKGVGEALAKALGV